MPTETIFYTTINLIVLAICAILSPFHSVSILEVRAATQALPLLDSQKDEKIPHDCAFHLDEERNSFTLYVKRGAQTVNGDDDNGWMALSASGHITECLPTFGERIWFLQQFGLLTKLLGEQLDEGMKLRLCKRGRLLFLGSGCSETVMFRNGRWMREGDGKSPLKQGSRIYSIPLLSKEEMATSQRAKLLRLIGKTHSNKTSGVIDDLLLKEGDIKIGPTAIYV